MDDRLKLTITEKTKAECEARGIKFDPSVQVVSDAREADVALVVCVPFKGAIGAPLLLPDNVLSTCAWCPRKIEHRPNLPPKAKRICMACYAQLLTSHKH